MAVGVEWSGMFCIAFIDGTLRRMCRPQGLDDLQRGVYYGHHWDHGLAYQPITGPNGMFLDFFGPVCGRRHDSYILLKSGFNDRMRNLADQLNMPHRYYAYGDAVYPKVGHVQTGYRGPNITPGQR